MQPNQNQYSIDYLNQIATPAKKPGMSQRMIYLMIGVGALIAVVIGLSLFSGGSNSAQKLSRLSARLQTLQTIVSKSQKTIKSGDLRTTNSNLSIFLTNTNRDITTPLANNGVNASKLDKTIVTSENGAKLIQTLENARLNAVFDRTYAREISYQLATVKSLMKEIYNNTNSKSLKDFLNTTNDNLQPIQKQLEDFNAANG
jgi:hypothetical protein